MLQLKINGNGHIVRFRPRFRLEPPKAPFLDKMPVSISLGQGISAEWLLDEPEKKGTSSKRLLDDVIDRIVREVRRYPKSVRARVNLATALLNARRIDESAEQLEQALEIVPSDYLVKLTLARARIAQSRLDEAEALYRGLQDLAPFSKNPVPLMGLAYIAIQRRDFDLAVELLRKLTTFGSTEIMARYHLATILMEQGNYRESISNLRRAAREDVRSAALHEALGVAYASSGDWTRASRSLNVALTLAPGTSETVRAISQIAAQQGRYENAVLLLKDLVVKFPADFRSREVLGHSYLALREYSRARDQFQSAIELRESSGNRRTAEIVTVANNLGVCFFFLGDVQNAKRWYGYAIDARDDASPIPYNNLARLRLREGEPSEALALAESAVRKFPDDQDTRLTRAYCFLELNRVQESFDELSAVIEGGKATAPFYAALSFILADRKRDFRAALEILKTGYRQFKDSPTLVNNLAYVHLMLGQRGEAREVLESTRLDSVEKSSRVALTATWGLLYLWEGDIERGRSEYRRAEELATQISNRKLGRTVKQKMHLELARAYLRRGALAQASLELSAGLSVEDRTHYREDLEMLNQDLMERVSRQ